MNNCVQVIAGIMQLLLASCAAHLTHSLNSMLQHFKDRPPVYLRISSVEGGSFLRKFTRRICEDVPLEDNLFNRLG